MELLDFIFRLGVVFAIYGFIWGLIEIALFILSSKRQRSLGEIYFIRAIKYLFLVDVTFLFCISGESSNMVITNQIILAGIILLMYFMGKLQNNRGQKRGFQIAGAMLPGKGVLFSVRAETIVIILALAVFCTFWFFPQYASNPISKWFHESIINIWNTPIFGFIFKVIGFFFLVSILFKMLNAITFILNRGNIRRETNAIHSDQGNDNDFDDYEEIN
ncbi:MAG: hypothetical protein JKY09_07905 [Crocinitomicaceae bacterium]|nr:hypothetical protein [Crocinitomicaceae bacterium]